MPRRLLYMLLALQILTHLLWLSPAAHSGQVAIPWMMNQGMTLFGDIWEQHAPGSSLLAAAAQMFIDIDPGLLAKLLNIALVLALTALVFQLAKQLTGDDWAGVLAAAVFAWWEPVYGNSLLYFDTLLGLCLLAALVVNFRNGEGTTAKQIAAVGLLMGASTLFKQHAWLAVGLMGAWLLLTERQRRLALVYAGAALVLPLMQWIALWSGDLLDSYVFWNWTFNLSGYMDGVPLDGDLFRKLLLTNALVFPFAALAIRGNRRHLILVAIWLASATLLYPRAGENHAMAHLPFAAVMSGIVLATIMRQLVNQRAWGTPRAILAGLIVAGGLGWLWTGAVSYIPTPLGAGKILAYDEFRELADQLRERAEPDDTLFLLPETDSTPQLHPLTGMLPPGAWVKAWRWYFKPARVLETLTAEWEDSAPTWIVIFPDLVAAGEPGIRQLLDIVQQRYFHAFSIESIFDHGSAHVWKLVDTGAQAPP